MNILSWIILYIFLLIAGCYANYQRKLPITVFCEVTATAVIVMNIMFEQMSPSDLCIALISYPTTVMLGYASMGLYNQNKEEINSIGRD